jgi:hypothetical protein
MSEEAGRRVDQMRSVRVRLLLSLTLALVLSFAVTATAWAETVGEPTPTPLPKMRLEDDDLRMVFSGTWRSSWAPASSGQTHRMSRTAGAAAEASFEGTSVAFTARRAPDRGRARIYLDGVAVATVDLYASVLQGPRAVWRSEPLPYGTHRVRVQVLGTRVAAASDCYVAVDAFDVVGRVPSRAAWGTVVNSGNSLLARWGSWWTSSQDPAIGDSAWRTKSRGATATLRFKGTRFAILGAKAPICGRAEIFIDGKKVAVLSQYRSTTAYRRVMYARSGLPYGTHVVTVRALASPSTGTGVRTDVDAFLADGTVLKAYSPTPFRYPWKTYILIDKSSFRLHWVKNGYLIKSYPIAHGRPSMPTPSRIWRIDAKYYTDPSSVYGPRKMRMFRRISTSHGYVYEYTRYAIHGTNEPWVIGTMASHGCIRMYNRDVLQLFPQVPLHTMVITRD